MSPSRSDLLKNLGLAVVSTLVFLFLIEMVLRVTRLVPARSLEYATPEVWSLNPGPLKPGQAFTDHSKRGLEYRLSVNSLGFRGPEFAIRKTPGTLRVLCLGDSYTFGAYVDDDQTWPAQLDATLKERRPDLPVEVINAGISGFTIEDELAFMREHGLGLDPDVVVVGFVLNDLADLTRRVASREMIRIASEEDATTLLGPLRVLLRQTAIYNSLFQLKARYRKATGTDPTLQEVDIRHLLEPDYDAKTLGLFETYRDRLASLKRLLDDHGAPLVLMIFPYWEQISRGAPAHAQARMVEMARGLDVVALDLLPAFTHHDPTGRKFFHMPVDHHPSARGLRRSARELAAVLEPLLIARAAAGPSTADPDP